MGGPYGRVHYGVSLWGVSMDGGHYEVSLWECPYRGSPMGAVPMGGDRYGVSLWRGPHRGSLWRVSKGNGRGRYGVSL